ncbi:MAG: hypothetical protein GKR89_30500 [Candidatus Latescibacteria bacterium]|nr:hypothetical protein [Candidatus Latescibacterota bacterium]
MPKAPHYGIIYNWDGAPHGYSEYPQSMEQFLDKTYAVMRDTQVGAHFWSVGGELDQGPQDNAEPPGPGFYQGAAHFTAGENLRAMYQRGEDPYTSLIERGHQLGLHVYASVRMNDNHFGGMKPADMAGSPHPSLTPFRRDHPQYLLGDKTSPWFALSYDFAVAQVRQRRLDSIIELCQQHDWDGIELDWQRHAFHFDQDYGYRLRYLLTDLQRAVRQHTQQIALRRGRPFYLAARVNGYLDQCAHIGYDIPTWVQEGLVDILIPAGGAATETEAEIAAFKELCAGTDTAVYPGYDGGIPGVAAGPEEAAAKDLMMSRALAARHHHQGADGIYVFNWHANATTRRPLLTTIGDPATLRRTDKIYAATRRFLVYEGEWHGAYRNDRIRGTVPVTLQQTFTGDGPTILLDIADDLVADPPASVELRLRLEDWVTGDKVRVLWDDSQINGLMPQYAHQNDPYANPLSSPVSEVAAAIWLVGQLDPALVTPGQHQVKVVLDRRNPLLGTDITLTDVELIIRY